MIDRERLARALWSYVREHGWLELGGMDAIFMQDRFREVADDLAQRYESVDSGSASGSTTPEDVDEGAG